MKINREKLEEMMKLSDEELWREVKRLSQSYGIRLNGKEPTKEEMKRLRSIASGGKINIGEAMKLVNEYKRRDANG